MADEEVEETLHVARSVSVYRIPPRPGVTGWRSGEWLVADKLFSGRLRIIARSELCEIRLEDKDSGELFATCPVPYGQRQVAVEPVTDSSRYYVLRVEDPITRRHAFLGMGFDNRTDAFDFNEALVRHEQHVARERAAAAIRGGGGGGVSPAHPSASPHVAGGGSPAGTGAAGRIPPPPALPVLQPLVALTPPAAPAVQLPLPGQHATSPAPSSFSNTSLHNQQHQRQQQQQQHSPVATDLLGSTPQQQQQQQQQQQSQQGTQPAGLDLLSGIGPASSPAFPTLGAPPPHTPPPPYGAAATAAGTSTPQAPADNGWATFD